MKGHKDEVFEELLQDWFSQSETVIGSMGDYEKEMPLFEQKREDFRKSYYK